MITIIHNRDSLPDVINVSNHPRIGKNETWYEPGVGTFTRFVDRTCEYLAGELPARYSVPSAILGERKLGNDGKWYAVFRNAYEADSVEQEFANCSRSCFGQYDNAFRLT